MTNILRSALEYLIVGTVFLLVLSALTSCWESYKAEPERLGFYIRKDPATGCLYLEGDRGGITPRLRADGSHWCEPLTPQVQK